MAVNIKSALGLWHLYICIFILQINLSYCETDLLEQYVEHVGVVNSVEFSDSVKRTSVGEQNNENSPFLNKLRQKRQVVTDTQWTHSAVLDKNGFVVLRWQPRHQEILFRVEAKTLGYVGIGFSPNGGMKGADIVIGWVDDRTLKAELLDCHGAPDNEGSAPVKDEIDNYTLIRGSQNDTHTIIEFRRVLDTCDHNDYVLSSDTVRIIWALHDIDPRQGAEMLFHEEKRGVQSVHLLGPPPVFRNPKDNLKSWDVTLKNFKVQNSMDTVYWCKVFKAPTFNSKQHVVGFEPVIGERHMSMAHHMIMHECELDNDEDIDAWDRYAKEEGRLCYSDMPVDWEKCLTPLAAWAVGSKGEFFPEHVGVPLANRKNSYYMLEVHFDNSKMSSAIDTTGLRLHYTSELRKHEAGILVTGVAPSTMHFIPPYQKEYKTAGYCSLGCTKAVFPHDGINVVSVMLHSHLAGRKIKLRHVRAGKELPPLAEDNHYDFNYQQSRFLSQDTTILPNDGLITECTYSTTDRDKPTLGGYSTREEMCLAFVLHYPRTDLAGCYSVPPVKYFFENLGVKEFYGKNMTQVEEALLQGKYDAELSPTSTPKPFENKPGDELSPEANMRAIMALKNAKEYSIQGVTREESVFDKLVIKDPAEFRNKTFSSHLESIPYNETILTKKIEEYFYNGLHLTFCRKRDDTLAVKENVEKLPPFQSYKEKDSLQCSYKSKRSHSGAAHLQSPIVIVTIICNILSLILY